MPYDPAPRSSVREKIGYYLLGLAIGCVLLGVLIVGRRGATRPPPAGAPAQTPAPTGSTGG